MVHHLTAKGRHLPYANTQFQLAEFQLAKFQLLPPDTSERAPP